MNRTDSGPNTIAEILGEEPVLVEKIGGGKNSRVFKVELANGGRRVVKFYFSHPADTRDRLSVEFSSFQFLWAHDVRSVPEPLKIDADRHCAVYSYVEGDKRESEEIRVEDVDSALDFLGRLKELTRFPDASRLPSASEATFVLRDAVAILDARLGKLKAVESTQVSLYEPLQQFLKEDLVPFYDEVRSATETASGKHEELETPLPIHLRTLSPSDFGFHNALRTPAGQWVFHDFEYFGWDDPAKLVVDFILHPGMNLAEDMRAHFARGALRLFRDDEGLDLRLRLSYPIYGLKWCLILLNEFLAADRARRGFADAEDGSQDRGQIERRQLNKAKVMFASLVSHYEKFPYLG